METCGDLEELVLVLDQENDGELVTIESASPNGDKPIDGEDDFEHILAEEVQEAVTKVGSGTLITPQKSQQGDEGAVGYATSTIVLTTAAAVATAIAGFQIGKTMCKAAAAGANGAYQHFIDSDPTKPETWQPTSYFAPFMSGAASTGVVEVFRRFKGAAEEVDLDTIIQNAENWVALADEAAADNRGGLSSDQRNTAVAWIAEARRRLDEYIKCHSNGLHVILGPETNKVTSKKTQATPTPKADKVATTTTADNESTANKVAPVSAQAPAVVTFGAVSPAPAPAPVPALTTTNQRVTIGAMLELARKDANARNPSKDQLAQEDSELLNLIQALDNVVREVPIHVSRITSEQCEDNIRRNRALGSREFIAAMQSRARVMSTTFRQAIEEWARYPLLVITGSEFASMAIPEGSSAFQVFAKRFMALVRECPFKNPTFYGDDFDRALLGSGIFALHKSCRTKLFLFFKDLCDPTISTIFRSEPELFSYELAPGRFFPIDTSDMHWGMSCNSVPPELLPTTGDKAMLARVANITPRYADEEDRRTIALEFTLSKLLETIEAFYGSDGKIQVARIDMDVARQTLLEVTQADIDKYVGTFHRKLGIRGIKDLLDRYSVYVESRLTRPSIDPQVFALSDGFRLVDVVASIEAYNCLAGSTRVALGNGFSRSIDSIAAETSVLSFDAKHGGHILRPTSALQVQGTKACVELLFSDGRTVTCTPDHRFLCADGATWVAAGDMVTGATEITAGTEYPLELDKEAALEQVAAASGGTPWSLDLTGDGLLGYTLNMTDRREHAIAFAGLLGYLSTDSTVCTKVSKLFIGHALDAAWVVRDIQLLTGKVPASAVSGKVLEVWIPAELHRAMQFVGVLSINRITTVTSFPAFVLDPLCPCVVVQSFLGGLFGGDGVAPSTMWTRGRANHFSDLRFCLSRKGNVWAAQKAQTGHQLRQLLLRVGIPNEHFIGVSSMNQVTTVDLEGEAEVARRKAVEEKLSVTAEQELHPDASYSIVWHISTNATLQFHRTIGFRYCCHKQMRLSAACCYYQLRECLDRQKVYLQNAVLAAEAQLGRQVVGGVEASAVLQLATTELAKQEIVHPAFMDWRPRERKHIFQSARNAGMTIHDALAAFDTAKFFSQPCTKPVAQVEAVAAATDKVTYGVHEKATALPTFRVRLIGRRALAEPIPTFDLTVPSTENFLAQGLVAHNCGVDADMDAIEQAQQLSQQLSEERLALMTLPPHVRANASAQLDKVASLKSISEKMKLLQCVRTALHLIRNRVTLPLPTDAGRRLDQALGYFRSDGGVSGDVNRFNQIYPVFDDIYWRIRASRRGKERANRLVRVRFTDASAETDSLFRDLAGALGGLPVRQLHTQGSLFEVVDEFSVYDSHPSYDGAIKLCAKANKSEGRLYINDPVNGTVFVYLHQSPGVKAGSSVFHYKSGTRQYLIKARGLDAAIAFAGTGNYVAWPIGCEPLVTTVGDDIEQAVMRRAPKRCNLADACFRKDYMKDASAQEALVIIKLTESVRKQIVLFMNTEPGTNAGDPTSSEVSPSSSASASDDVPGDAPEVATTAMSYKEKKAAAQTLAAARETIALRQFESWLISRFNEPEWNLAGGEKVDPRALTLFLVEPSSMSAASASVGSPSPSTSSDVSSIIDWLIGTPPIEGREKRARAALDAELGALNADLQARTSLLLEEDDEDPSEMNRTNATSNAPASTITLTDDQHEVIRTLMAFDKEQALLARSLGGVLSPVPLDRAVGDFVNLLRSSVNPFGLHTDIPSLDGFRQSWCEVYKPEMNRIHAIVEQRKQEDAKRQRAKQEADEMERIQTMARLHAEHNAASAKATQLAYRRQFAQTMSHNRSRTPSPASTRLPCYNAAAATATMSSVESCSTSSEQ